MKTLYRLFGIFSVSGLLLLPLAGCEQDMGEPEPGEAVEEAGEGIGEGIEETGEGEPARPTAP